MSFVATLLTEPHLPGRTQRPSEEVFEPIKHRLAQTSSTDDLAQSDAFSFGIEAFLHGYFWEAHELWEAVWLRLPPASPERR